MNYKNTAAWGICLVLLVVACERPESPDFSLEHKVQVPLTAERTYQFLGQNNALIDTTNEDYKNLFEVDRTVDNTGLVSLSKQEDLEFGDLVDALPEVTIAPTGISSVVGEIVLGDFSSGGNVGSADFETITGLDSTSYSKDQQIKGGSTPGTINIPLTTDYFESATIKSGELVTRFTNNLGFDIDQLDLTLKSGTTSLESGSFLNFIDGEQITWNISFDPGTVLEDLNVDLTASWSIQDLKRDPESLDVNDVAGNNLIASQVRAAVPSQDFSAGGITPVDDTNFKFDDPDHYIELGSGELRVFDVVNDIDLDIEKLEIAFPTIRRSPYTASDALVLIFESIGKKCGCTNMAEQNISLPDYRIYTEYDNFTNEYAVPYTITGFTEDTQQSNDIRTINENDSFSASAELKDLKVREAHGIITPRRVLLNDDANRDGMLELSDNEEATSVSIDGLKNLSTHSDDLQFANPILSLLYNSNLDVETMIYAAIQGKSSDGNLVYLSGKSGDHKVSSTFNELQSGGQTLPSGNLIKFTLTRPDGSSPTGAEIFDKDNTNADKFLNNLPTEIRFIGLAVINEPQVEGTVTDPVRFDPSLGVDVPLHFSSDQITFSDTTEADLSDLPNADDQSLSEAKITIGYANRLPFGMDLNLIMIDEQYHPVTEIPLVNEDPISLNGAPIDQDSRFVEQEKEGKIELSLNREQLAELSKTRHMVIRLSFRTTNREEVKVRAEDAITLSVKMSVSINSSIN